MSPVLRENGRTAMPLESNDAAGAAMVVESYGRALQASDTDAILRMYADGAEIIPDQAPSLSGAKAIEAFYRDTFDTIRIEGALRVVSAEAHAALALVRCEESAALVALADGARTDTYFRELFVLRNTSAGWKIHKYMFSQNPSQAAAGREPGVSSHPASSGAADDGR